MIDSAREVAKAHQSKLKYPLNTMEWENHWWGYRFNSLEKDHEIVYPKDVCLEKLDSDRQLLNYLHELIRAYYSKITHPLFGGFAFDHDYPDKAVNGVSEAYRIACDWFIWD